jgi:2-iminobutanoate/2-iminopropanoate deaminase
MQSIHSDRAPKAVGPYSQAVKAGSFVYCSGQIALDPETNVMISGDVRAQTTQVLKNLACVLAAAACELKQVVTTTIYLTSMDDYASVNEVYSDFFMTNPKPARATVTVAKLPKGALVEISCVAYSS